MILTLLTMKKLALALLLLLALPSVAFAQAVGDLVTLRIATSQYNLAIVGKAVDARAPS